MSGHITPPGFEITFPPQSQCWANITNHYYSFPAAALACEAVGWKVTEPMVDYLNITQNIETYFQSYCLNPQSDDSCPFNYCPQPDVAGVLVRISSYIATLCLAIMLFFSSTPGELADAYWSQILTMYSILVAAAISIFQTNLTKFHAIIAAELIGSPLTFYMAIYAIRSFFGHQHRLAPLLGRGKMIYRTLALFTVILWLVLFIYVLLPSHVQNFAQASCDAKNQLVKLSYLIPVAVSIVLLQLGAVPLIVCCLPFFLIGFAWIIPLFLRRRELWYNTGKCKWPGFWRVWTMVGKQYPFIHFMAVCMVPIVLWMVTVEVTLINSNDQQFELSFGQILAVFVTIPPLVSVAKMIPRFGRWFANMAWVRFITFRPQIHTTIDDNSLPLVSHRSPRSSRDSFRSEK